MVAPVAVKEVKAVVAPTAPVMVTVPPVPPFSVSVRAPDPLIVLEKLILPPAGDAPAFVVSNVMLAPITATPVREMGCPRVVMLAFRLMLPTFVEPAVIVKEIPAGRVNALFTVIELAGPFCAQRITLLAAA